MTTLELKNKLAEILPDYEFNEISFNTDSIFGSKKQKPRMFRNEKKNSVKTKNRVIFVSGEMYPNTDRNFRYALNYTISEIRGYRCKYWSAYEYEKVFASGKTDEILIEEIKRLFK